jgi:hypothetical protein
VGHGLTQTENAREKVRAKFGFNAVNVANAHARTHTQKANTAKFARICVYFGADDKLYHRQGKS